MSGIGTSIIGAAIMGAVALLASIGPSKTLSPARRKMVDDVLKVVTAGGLAVGLVFLAVSLTQVMHFAADLNELTFLLGLPAFGILLFRVIQGWSKLDVEHHRMGAKQS